ncbi:MAG: hypothetical protein GEU80_13475 [Dehalococcoidia bacterium]|nr:hypothetical protein [Dehalococcoidia bacterium]
MGIAALRPAEAFAEDVPAGWTNGRGEHEVIVNPYGLRRIVDLEAPVASDDVIALSRLEEVAQ